MSTTHSPPSKSQKSTSLHKDCATKRAYCPVVSLEGSLRTCPSRLFVHTAQIAPSQKFFPGKYDFLLVVAVVCSCIMCTRMVLMCTTFWYKTVYSSFAFCCFLTAAKISVLGFIFWYFLVNYLTNVPTVRHPHHQSQNTLFWSCRDPLSVVSYIELICKGSCCISFCPAVLQPLPQWQYFSATTISPSLSRVTIEILFLL